MRIFFSTRYPFLPVVLCLLFSLIAQQPAFAQYFGRNKVLYQDFHFKVLQSPHFEIYHYLQSDSAGSRLAARAEEWYQLHQSVLKDSFKKQNPLIVYNHHAHFQQTRAVNGPIDVGTGGVTEALKNRVIFPFLESNAQTDHVLGHELVHAFQYHLIKDSLKLNALNNLPLWMVEGMAEYMSGGYKDAHTAMWMRSAMAHQKLPTLKDLTMRPHIYFPYRWGEAFWAYTTGVYGDSIIRRLFLETGRKGYASAIKSVLKIDEKEFSKRWQQSIRNTYEAYMETKDLNATGKLLVNKEKGGRYNIVPSISPDGKLLAFWTEKDLFSLDLYLADATSGKMLRKITSNSLNAHTDQYSAYESSVAWSPDSKRIAFVAFAKGHNRLIIAGTNGKTENQIDLSGITGFTNPAWSPDGHTIVVSAIVEGQHDLYAYDLFTGNTKQLTNDRYSEIMPGWSNDGKWIVFSSDQMSVEASGSVHRYAHQLLMLNAISGERVAINVFPGANNMNPVFSADDHSIYFLSDRDGFRNLYAYDISTKEASQLTDFFSGISGITDFAPAISIAKATHEMVYNYFDDGAYAIFKNDLLAWEKKTVNVQDVNQEAALLPPLQRKGPDFVQRAMDSTGKTPAVATREIPYRSKFSLAYVGNTGMGIQGGGGYGVGLAGGVNTLFTDMLGNHQLFGAISLNGEILDIAGQFAYFNQKKRCNWGVSVSHIPYLSGAQYLFRDTIVIANDDSMPVLNYSLDLLRTFEDQLSVFASYPFSVTKRLEAGASFAHYYYRLDRYTEYYDEKGSGFLKSEKHRQPVPKGFQLGQVYLAFVSDHSSFGVASPLKGHRLRLEATRYMGVVNMTSLVADYRKYIRLSPLSIALRNMYMGRYGQDDKTGLLPPLFLGYASLVRGYDALNYSSSSGTAGLTINDLIGNRIYVSNIELRFPFSGPERLSAVKSRFFFTEFNLFTDGGVAWGRSDFFGSPQVNSSRSSRFILSTGLSLRLNLFGYLVIEPYYAIPWQNGGWKNRNFGLNILPGW